MSTDPDVRQDSMSKLQELARIIDSLDDEGPDYQNKRNAKRLIHDLIKAEEARA